MDGGSSPSPFINKKIGWLKMISEKSKWLIEEAEQEIKEMEEEHNEAKRLFYL